MSGEGCRFPLTAAQAGVWFAQQLDPANPLFRVAEYVDIAGRADLVVLETAVRQAVADVEAFLVHLEIDAAGVWQVVDRAMSWSLPVLDFRAAPDALAQAQTWMHNDLRRSVDLGRGPLFDFAVLRVADDRVLLYLSAHHVTMDGFGAGLFIQRVSDVYSALEAGHECPAGELGSLASLTSYEAGYRESARFARDREYWMTQLNDRPAAVGLAGRLTRSSHTFLHETGTVAA